MCAHDALPACTARHMRAPNAPGARDASRSASVQPSSCALYWSAVPDSAPKIAGLCVWTRDAEPISSAPSARRTGNEMVCTGSASGGHRTEGHAPRRLKARRGCCALTAARTEPAWWLTGLWRLRGRIQGAGAVRGGAEGTAGCAVSAKAAPRRRKHAERMACAGFGAVRARLREHRLTLDNWCYRESIAKFRRFDGWPAKLVQSRACNAGPVETQFNLLTSRRFLPFRKCGSPLRRRLRPKTEPAPVGEFDSR